MSAKKNTQQNLHTDIVKRLNELLNTCEQSHPVETSLDEMFETHLRYTDLPQTMLADQFMVLLELKEIFREVKPLKF